MTRAPKQTIPSPPGTMQNAQHWPRAGASIAVFKDDQILLAQRAKEPAKGIWSLPGGHIERGETAASAALRELHEETGVTAQLIAINDVVDVILNDGDNLRAHYVISSYFGIWTAGTPIAASDAADARWVSLSGLGEWDLTDQTTRTIQSAHTKLRAWLEITEKC